MRKTKLILSIIALCLTLAVAIPLIYSWYIYMERVGDMSFDILQIDSLVSFYEAEDSNYNGVPDLCATENYNKYYNEEANAYVSYAKQYYNEKYAFDYLDQRYALSFDSEANLLNTVSITNAKPSKIYSYKFEITNYAGFDNTLEFSFANDNSIQVNTLKEFEVRLGVVDSDAKVTFTQWTSFCTENNGIYTYSGLTLNPLLTDIVVPATTGSLSVGRLDLWLQIRIKSSCTNYSITNFSLPEYRIELSAELPDGD